MTEGLSQISIHKEGDLREENPLKLTRREFLRHSGLLIGGVSLAMACGLGITEPTSSLPPTYPARKYELIEQTSSSSNPIIPRTNIPIPIFDNLETSIRLGKPYIQSEKRSDNNGISWYWRLTAFDRSTNQELWHKDNFNIFKGTTLNTIVIADQTGRSTDNFFECIFDGCFFSDYFSAFDLKSGKELWNQKLNTFKRFIGNENEGLFAVEDGYKAFGINEKYKIKLIKIDPRSGKRLWELGDLSDLEFYDNSIRLFSNYLIFITSPHDIIAINHRDGKVTGRTSLVRPVPYRPYYPAFVEDEHRIFIAIEPHLIELNKSNGKIGLENYFADLERYRYLRENLSYSSAISRIGEESIMNLEINNGVLMVQTGIIPRGYKIYRYRLI